MRTICLMFTIVSMFLFLAGPVMALEMPDLSVDGYLLYDLNTRTTSVAPGISACLIRTLDGIVEGNVGVAFPAQNDDTTKSFVAGPIIDFNLVKAIQKLKNIEIVAKGLNLSAGIGFMVDVAHISGRSIKEIVIPTAHIRFTF